MQKTQQEITAIMKHSLAQLSSTQLEPYHCKKPMKVNETKKLPNTTERTVRVLLSKSLEVTVLNLRRSLVLDSEPQQREDIQDFQK